MKIISTLLLVGAVTLGFTVANSAKADAFLSPRAQANQITVAAGGAKDARYVSGSYAGAALKSQTLPNAVATTSVKQPNLVSGNYAGAAGKNPAAGGHFQIGPVVAKGK